MPNDTQLLQAILLPPLPSLGFSSTGEEALLKGKLLSQPTNNHLWLNSMA